MKKRGYLLVEMMISLVIVTILALIIASIQAQIALWHSQAEQYLMATTLAQELLTTLEHSVQKKPTKDGFTIEIQGKDIHPNVPYTLYTITIGFHTAQGATKHIIVEGGAIHAKK